MDDIRRPQHLQRRDYAIPAGRPAGPPKPQATEHQAHRPQTPQPPAYHPNLHHTAQPHNNHHAAASSATPQTYHNAPQLPHHYPAAQPQTRPAPTPAHATPKKKLLSGKMLSLAAALIVAAGAVFGAGYLLKGSSDAKGIPASITRQVNYDLYFPSPMPAGYIYMKDTATFQIGQVFYKFSKGNKRVTVNEQPMPSPKPDLSKMAGYTQFQSPIGPAAIGKDLGEPTAVVITPTTVITMHTIGGVSQDDLKTAISNLKNIGQNPNHK